MAGNGALLACRSMQMGRKSPTRFSEDAVEGYTPTYTDFNVTNSHTPETIDISGSKTWDDKENQDGKRPESITIRLYADGKELRRLEVNEEDNWKWLFEDLPKYENGREIVILLLRMRLQITQLSSTAMM